MGKANAAVFPEPAFGNMQINVMNNVVGFLETLKCALTTWAMKSAFTCW